MLCAGDGSFGPVIQGCRDDYDFTLLFQQMVLRLGPAIIFVVLGTVNALSLRRKSRRKCVASIAMYKQVRNACPTCRGFPSHAFL
jgi:hypothetical protein